jgi:hypothetical protein
MLKLSILIAGLLLAQEKAVAQDISSCNAQFETWANCVNESPECGLGGCSTDAPPNTCADTVSFTCSSITCCDSCDSDLFGYTECILGLGCPDADCEILEGGSSSSIPDGDPSMILDDGDHLSNLQQISKGQICQTELSSFYSCADRKEESDPCDTEFNAYDTCIGGVGISNPLGGIHGLGWCRGLHSVWKACVKQEGCTADCNLEMPITCEAHESTVCGKISCCAGCEDSAADSYATCGETVGCAATECSEEGRSGACSMSASMMTTAVLAGAGVLAIV